MLRGRDIFLVSCVLSAMLGMSVAGIILKFFGDLGAFIFGKALGLIALILVLKIVKNTYE